MFFYNSYHVRPQKSLRRIAYKIFCALLAYSFQLNGCLKKKPIFCSSHLHAMNVFPKHWYFIFIKIRKKNYGLLQSPNNWIVAFMNLC